MPFLNIKDQLFEYKHQLDWWFDKLCLLVIGTVAYGLAVSHPFFWEDWNVFKGGSDLVTAVFTGRGRGFGRFVGNALSFSLVWNPFGLVQLGELIGISCIAMFIWKVLRAEALWVRATLSSLFLFGFPYFVHGIVFRAIGNNHGISTLVFIGLLTMIARGDRPRVIDQLCVACLAAFLALSYEPWLMFLVGVSLLAIGAKLVPRLAGKLRIYKMSNREIFAIGLPIAGCLVLRVFTLEGQGAIPAGGVAPSALFKLTIVTARILMNILVDSLPIGAIIGFGVMRSTKHPVFSKKGLWPHFLFGSIFATVATNFSYGLLLNGGVMDWRTRYVIMLMLSAFYFSLPWGTIGDWIQERTGIVAKRGSGFAVALLGLKLVYTIVFSFIITPVHRLEWMHYRSRILARDPSVLQDFTDFGQCDNKYCYSFSGPGFTHPYILQYWKGGTSAQLIPWLPIEGFY